MSALESWLFASSLAGQFLLVPASSLLIFYLLYARKRKEAIFLLAGYFGGIVLNWILKEIFQIPRPSGPLIPISGYGFPSGHAMSAVLFYSLLIFIFYKEIKNKNARITFVAINVLVVLLVGLSRFMLRVHSITDVVGGYVFGLLWLLLIYRILEKIKF